MPRAGCSSPEWSAIRARSTADHPTRDESDDADQADAIEGQRLARSLDLPSARAPACGAATRATNHGRCESRHGVVSRHESVEYEGCGRRSSSASSSAGVTGTEGALGENMSIWPRTGRARLQSLQADLQSLQADIDRLNWLCVERGLVERLGRACQEVSSLRAELLATTRRLGLEARWSSEDQLRKVIEGLEAHLDSPRARAEALADELRRGTITAARGTETYYAEQIEAAIDELESLTPSQTLPGPSPLECLWIDSVLALDRPAFHEVTCVLPSIGLPHLYGLLMALYTQPDWWASSKPDPEASPEEASPSEHDAMSRPALSAHVPATVPAHSTDPREPLPEPPTEPEQDAFSVVDADLFQGPGEDPVDPNADSNGSPSGAPVDGGTADQTGDEDAIGGGDDVPEQEPHRPEGHERPVRISKRASSIQPGPSEVRESLPIERVLPAEVLDYAEYARKWWAPPNLEHIRRAPWTEAGFGHALREHANVAAARTDFATLRVLVRAALHNGHPPPVAEADLDALSRLWQAPRSTAAAVDRERHRRLSRAVGGDGSELEHPARWLVACFLEALRPLGFCEGERWLVPDEIEALELFVLADTHPALRSFIVGSLNARMMGVVDPTEMLRKLLIPSVPAEVVTQRALKRIEQATDDIKQSLRIVDEMFRNLITKHCRWVWRDFIDEYQSWFAERARIATTLVREWRKGRQDAVLQWADEIDPDHLDEILVAWHAMADAGEAKAKDRRRMDNTVYALTESVRHITEAALELRRLHTRGDDSLQTQLHGQIDVVTVKAFLDASGISEPWSALCQRVARRIFGWPDEPSPAAVGTSADLVAGATELTLAHFCLVPGLLDATPIPDQLPAEWVPTDVMVHVDELTDITRAAAIMVAEPGCSLPEVQAPPSLAALAEHLQSCNRPDLLMYLPWTHGGDHPRRHTVAERRPALHELQEDLEQLAIQLGRLADPVAGELRHLVAEAVEQSQRPELRASSVTLMEGWLSEARRLGGARVKQRLADLTRQADVQGLSAEVAAALDEERYGEAMIMLGNNPRDVHSIVELSDPEIWWHPVVPPRRPHDPRTLRKRLSADVYNDAPIVQLLQAWHASGRGDRKTEDRVLRRAFVEVFFSELILYAGGEVGAAASYKPGERSISCELIRRWLDFAKMNPCYLAQLAQFDNLVVTTADQPTSSDEYRSAVRRVALSYPDSLCLFLAPNISQEIREETLRELRRSNVCAALIDDEDILRLLDLRRDRPKTVIAIFEIALAQMEPASVQPFAMVDGKDMHMEMFVGRRDEAEQLAKEHTFTRLFSGRKLGKSALLQYVRHRYDGTPLPSGLTLRVLYVSAVGCSEEVHIVDWILQELGERRKFDTARFADGPQWERLTRALETYLFERPDDSLLIVLDEADTFVEAQLRLFETKGEATLTWHMRSRITNRSDSKGLPRIRFVFSGYRVTNTTAGPWFNWGSVLRLQPLDLDHAVQLVAGPPGRMGIDVARYAPEIAFHCGYQPAVIIRFGELLMRPGGGIRPGRMVDRSEIQAVLNSDAIQEEIALVTWNNFQGDRRAGAVFAALVGEFVDASPGVCFQGGARRVLNRLRRAAPDRDLTWLDDNSPLELAITEMLRVFEERGLIRFDRDKDEVYYRFPHHLMALRRAPLDARIRAEIDALRRQASIKDGQDRARSLFGRGLLDRARAAIEHGNDSGVRWIVAGSHWPRSLEHPTSGLIETLTLDLQDRTDRASAVSGDLEQLIAEKAANGGTPHVLYGGAALVRWACDQRPTTDTDPLLIYQGRLEPATLSWWFERVLGFEFAEADSLHVIHRQTYGIPLLVDCFERLLLTNGDRGGINISNFVFRSTMQAFESERSALLERLLGGDPTDPLALSPEELRVIRMVVRASEDTNAEASIREDLTHAWSILYEDEKDEPLSVADEPAVLTLLALGVLPAGELDFAHPLDALVALHPADPIRSYFGS